MEYSTVKFYQFTLLSFLLFMAVSCSTDKIKLDDLIADVPCSDASAFTFIEKDGLISVEFENAEFTGDWKLKKDGNSYSGKGYMLWEGPQHLRKPQDGITSFKIKIENPGTYRFVWKSAVKNGNSATDHNDSWLRFADADDFFAINGDNKVYPKGTGKSPNPAGDSFDGWFKIFRGGDNLDFKWQSSTYDHNSHDIFIQFSNAGVYTMEVAPRSSGHGIDKFVLFKETSFDEATSDSNDFSEITCK